MSAVHFIHDGILLLPLIYGTIASIKSVAGSSLALCEGGQTCLPPKECCAQGCCYLYAPPGAPRVPLASNDHMLSMLFLNHWYFWCFVLAIILALLCTCSLWKKRRQLCGWDTSARHSHSEGDSAGSCYAPPQYSRCNSFHIHAPPPYTEVASKPDLYPLVFSYTDPGKGNGANYLMVQYFRNYIVQPVGSISGTSTVDSLSSSFICNANEANTLVPPPYSRAASPDPTMSLRNYLIPRSASQQVCLSAAYVGERLPTGTGTLPSSRSHAATYQRDDEALLEQQCMLTARDQQQQPEDEVQSVGANTTTINHTNFSNNNVSLMECSSVRGAGAYHHPLVNFMELGPSSNQIVGANSTLVVCNRPAQPEAARPGSMDSFPSQEAPTSSGSHHSASRHHSCLESTNELCDLSADRPAPRGGGLVCKLCCSTGDIASSASVTGGSRAQHRADPKVLHKSLETCCHVKLHGIGARFGATLAADSEDLLLSAALARKGPPLCARSSCAASSAGSNVSSLVNLDASSSPPRATSPTAEVRELLEQIRQLHNHEDEDDPQLAPASFLQTDTDGQVSTHVSHGITGSNMRLPTSVPTPGLSAYRRPSSLISKRRKLFSSKSFSQQQQQQQQQQLKQQQQQQHQQHHHSTHHSKTMYIPISFTQNCIVSSASGRLMRSPAAGSSGPGGFLNRGRNRYCWMSKSAPTTPGAAPGSFVGGTPSDNRPLLLHEQEEDGDQNV